MDIDDNKLNEFNMTRRRRNPRIIFSLLSKKKNTYTPFQILKLVIKLCFFNKKSIDKSLKTCYAPYTSVHFGREGNMHICCMNRSLLLGNFPETTVENAWNNSQREALKVSLAKGNFSRGCDLCSSSINDDHFQSVFINVFDMFQNNYGKKPKYFSFELSNTCNLECVMCGGKWSSKIRSDREGLPPIFNPYGQDFVDQVKKFFPTIERVSFLGGEPFLIDVYYKLWEELIKVNCFAKIEVITNGTCLPNRAKELLCKTKNPCGISVSMDSLRKETFEFIRKGGSFLRFKENVNFLLEKKLLTNISVSPMIQNWQDIPEIIEFCQRNKLHMFFNIVREPLGGRIKGIHENGEKDYIWNKDKTKQMKVQCPLDPLLPEVSLTTLSDEKLQKIIEFFSDYKFESYYQEILNSFVNWLESQKSLKAKS